MSAVLYTWKCFKVNLKYFYHTEKKGKICNMMEILANAMEIILLEYTSVLNQNIVKF